MSHGPSTAKMLAAVDHAAENWRDTRARVQTELRMLIARRLGAHARVLIVEDEMGIAAHDADVIRRNLGVDVDVAATPREARFLGSRHDYNVILCDLGLPVSCNATGKPVDPTVCNCAMPHSHPDSDPFDLLRDLRRHGGALASIVIISGLVTTTHLRDARRLTGAVAAYERPVPSSVLVAIVRDLLGGAAGTPANGKVH